MKKKFDPSSDCVITSSPKNKGDVILLHGYLSSPLVYQNFASQLTEKGYNTIRCTARGHEHRYFTSNKYEWKENLAELEEIIKSRQNKKIILIGHSMGGTLALTEGLKNPKVTQVFAISAINNNHVFLEKINNNPKLQQYITSLKEYDAVDSILPSNYTSCNKHNKTKFYLIHTKDDKIVPFDQLKANQSQLCLPSSNISIIPENKKDPTIKYGHIGVGIHPKTIAFVLSHLK